MGERKSEVTGGEGRDRRERGKEGQGERENVICPVQPLWNHYKVSTMASGDNNLRQSHHYTAFTKREVFQC